ncbi:hypothetical protein CC78DRAFT_528357 [Lojkania enalia]|uniref:Uncharacterized protein n=1 Tax=Lojkania enalia TaxID=147567 RepID=A0A9P4NCD1_9PLEO|nr:hypothetical protein CC78DRAFT_528357 [Didymosphaeria enalia]
MAPRAQSSHGALGNSQRHSTEGQLQPAKWLVWAHQLKQEHGYLLGRMDSVEIKHGAYDSRIQFVEAAAGRMKESEKEIKELVKRIAVVEGDEKEIKDWFGEDHVRIQKDAEKITKIQQNISSLEKKHSRVDSEIQQLSTGHRSTVEKVEAIERTLQKQAQDTEGLAKNDPNDARALKSRLDFLDSPRFEECNGLQLLQNKVAGLERACQRCNAKNQELEAEIARLKIISRTEAQQLPSSSSESTNYRLHSHPSRVQVPASPLLKLVNGKQQDKLFMESPTFDARQRKLTKLNADVPSEGEQIPRTSVATMERRRDTANASENRKRAPGYEGRQTRSQAKSQQVVAADKRRPTKIAVLKIALENRPSCSNTSGPQKHSAPSTSVQAGGGMPISRSTNLARLEDRPAKRKRREIPQDEDLEAFMTSALSNM